MNDYFLHITIITIMKEILCLTISSLMVYILFKLQNHSAVFCCRMVEKLKQIYVTARIKGLVTAILHNLQPIIVRMIDNRRISQFSLISLLIRKY